MFAHKIIESFSRSLKNGITCPYYRQNIVNVNRAIREKAVHFYLGSGYQIDVAFRSFRKDTDKPPLFLGEAAVDIRLPYAQCLFMFREGKTITIPGNVPTTRRAVLVSALADDVMIAYVIAYFDDLDDWILSPQAYMISVGKPLSQNKTYLQLSNTLQSAKAMRVDDAAFSTGHDGVNIQTIRIVSKLTPEQAHQATLDDTRDLTVLNGTLLLMNCKNVGFATTQAAWKLNKKRIKNGHEPIMDFKTLTIKLPGGKGTRAFFTDNTSSDAALPHHKCRGHFKTYTEDAPLFGRITGRYWWSDQMRGDKANGEIKKDYHIKAA